jgi:activator of HSP90 ATPase
MDAKQLRSQTIIPARTFRGQIALMKSISLNRRDFSIGIAALFSGLGIAPAAWGRSTTAADEEISLAGEAIHQEVIFKASPKRVYAALTDARQFDKVVHLSEAGMSLGKASTEISAEAGGTFSLFGGYISGRHIELVPDERIVQAWRTGSWKPGSFSIAKFVLTPQDSGTKLVFDHTGFPAGEARSLAAGWKANYWTPLQKYLAQ